MWQITKSLFQTSEIATPARTLSTILGRVQHTLLLLQIWIEASTFVNAGQGQTEDELDRKCELYLDRHFRAKLDFALESTLPDLIKDGLIHRDHQVRSLRLSKF